VELDAVHGRTEAGEEGPHAHRNPEMELKVDVERLRRTTVLGATPSLGNLAS
jgi:hypothetical protein